MISVFTRYEGVVTGLMVIKLGGGAGIQTGHLLQELRTMKDWVLVHGGSDGMNELSEKLGHPPRFVESVSGYTSRVTDQGTVEIDYQLDQNVGTDTWTVLGTAATVPTTDTLVNLGAKLQIRFRLRFQNSNSRTPTILSGMQVGGRMMGLTKYQFVGTFKMEVGGETLTGDIDADANTVYTQLQSWAAAQTKLTMHSLDPSKDGKIVTVSLPAKSVDWIDPDELSWGGRVSFAILEA